MRAVIGKSAGKKVTWNRIVTNGGGLLPGLSIADDGTKTCYTDTAGGYIYDDNAGIWKQMCSFLQNHNSDQYEWLGYRGMVGLADLQIAPGNSNYIYYFMGDNWWNNRATRAFLNKSTDKGLTSNPTAYPYNTQVDGNGTVVLSGGSGNNNMFKRVQCKIGIDPINENVVYVTNPGARPLVTFDAGASFSYVPDLPVGTTTGVGAVCWQFDRSSGTASVNGKTVTKTIHCVIFGSGAWKSTDGGVSFSQTSSSVGSNYPAYCSISADGVYYLSDLQTNSASFTGAISGTTLTVSPGVTGTINPGNPLTGGVSAGTLVVQQLTGTTGKDGTYTVSASQTVATRSMTIASAQYSTLNRYQSGAWSVIWQNSEVTTNIAQEPRGRICVAAHPTTNGTVVALNSNATPHFIASSDYGSTWTRTNKTSENVTASTDAPWYTSQLSDINLSYAVQQCVFNRSDGKLYLNYGQGMVRSDITVGVVPTWEAITNGIEQTVCYGVCHESGAPLLQSCNDVFGFRHDTSTGLQTPPSECIAGLTTLTHSWGAVIDPYNTQNQFLQGYNAINGASAWYYSTDGGTTWNLMANTPNVNLWQGAYTATTLAMANGVILWAPAISGGSTPAYIYRTADFGATPWVAIDHSAFNNGSDFPATGGQGWGFGNLNPKNVIAFDRVNSSKVYAFNFWFQTPAIKGMYVSTDAGLNWTYKGTASDPNSSSATGFYCIKAAPGIEGTVFASSSYNATQPPPGTGTGASLYKTTDGFATPATALTRVKEVLYMGFGKAGPSGLPTLYIAGWVDRNYGIHMSPDLGTTWIQLVSDAYGPWPMHNDAVYGIEGDKDVYGRCYVSFRGSGSVYSTLV